MLELPKPLKTPLLDILGCRLPILLAGMGGVARHELAAAVIHAGGFGVMGMVREPVERIRNEITALRKLTDAPFGINLIPASTDADLLARQVKACLEMKTPVIVLFWKVDVALVRYLKSEGVLVIHQVGNQLDADAAINAGVDILIVQGVEAGGHVRGNTSTFALLPQIAAQSPVPVVASGGIASGHALVAALALGAQGVSLGTAFLATHEANAHSHHKNRVLKARADDTIYTTRFARNWQGLAPVRVLANRVLDGYYDQANQNTIIGKQDGQNVYLFSTDSPLADATGEIDDMAIYCGQSCGQLNELCSAGERIEHITKEAVQYYKSIV